MRWTHLLQHPGMLTQAVILFGMAAEVMLWPSSLPFKQTDTNFT